ncbi:hypothetical protein [Lyngbya confervoides]|uniref:Lipoprotein n=1 Tax=Lyngbya confervoides BDU141951 TaxID=1574623 RepID=A0ABD4T5D0_9CYAN|nr:hypothetical protein [Lyngbya confervoides]MCM1983765.1 hypothetical protein [Lyngbya confervoides BDU141951]
MLPTIKGFRAVAVSMLLVCLLFVSGCGSLPAVRSLPGSAGSQYAQIEQGNTPAGQDFGAWVMQTATGLIQDAYVRNENKLGVVITPQVDPSDVKPLARSLVSGFHKNFPQRDLTVLVYAPDKQLILRAEYDNQSNNIQYNAA